MRVRVIGLGQRAAGDDGAGIAVIEALRRTGVPEDVECAVVAGPSALVALLWTPGRVIVVDAVVVPVAGEVIDIDVDRIDPGAPIGVSSHGLGVRQAIALARLAEPELTSPDIHVVGVSIARPSRYVEGLSPIVAVAVERAAQRILELVGK
jgi:hydrogenase maturation protease